MIIFFSLLDIVKQVFRKNHQTTPRDSAVTDYVFQWHLLAELLAQTPTSLKNMFLRIYLKTDQEYTCEDEKIMLTLTMNIYNASRPQNGAENSYTYKEDTSITQQSQEIIIAPPSDQWVEINLTKIAMKLWSHIKYTTEVRVTVMATTDCVDQVNFPISFINPAEIPLESNELRENLVTSAQPLLVVFANNEYVFKEIHKNHDTMSHAANRSKRSSSGACHREDHQITFSDLDIDVLVPQVLNIGKCSGSCTEYDLRQDSSLGTNHAKIMSSVMSIQTNYPEITVTSSGPATTPCCVPATYNQSIPLIVNEGSGVSHTRYFSDLVVQSCSCQ